MAHLLASCGRINSAPIAPIRGATLSPLPQIGPPVDYATTLAGSPAGGQDGLPSAGPTAAEPNMTERQTAGIVLRSIRSDDRMQWDPLWAGYLRFYRQRLPPATTDETFRRLCNPEGPLFGIVAATGSGRLAGFAHFLF